MNALAYVVFPYDLVCLLAAVLLVVLIIYFAKRA